VIATLDPSTEEVEYIDGVSSIEEEEEDDADDGSNESAVVADKESIYQIHFGRNLRAKRIEFKV
jgi:hypothetical protein